METGTWQACMRIDPEAFEPTNPKVGPSCQPMNSLLISSSQSNFSQPRGKHAEHTAPGLPGCTCTTTSKCGRVPMKRGGEGGEGQSYFVRTAKERMRRVASPATFTPSRATSGSPRRRTIVGGSSVSRCTWKTRTPAPKDPSWSTATLSRCSPGRANQGAHHSTSRARIGGTAPPASPEYSRAAQDSA